MKTSASDYHLANYRGDGVAKGRYSSPANPEYYLGQFVRNTLPDGGKHLSIGCNTGIIANLLAGKGKYIKGIELVPELCEKACQNGVFAKCGKAEDAEKLMAGNTFKTIDCIEVLEHVNDPGAVLTAIANLLIVGGVAIVSVPNAEGFLEGKGDFHFNFFNKTQFEDVLKQHFKGFYLSIAMIPYTPAYCELHRIDPTQAQWIAAVLKKGLNK